MAARVSEEADGGGRRATSAEQLYDLLAARGVSIEVRDERRWANFGDLVRRGKPVATPLWVATQHTLDGEMVYLPVPHAQLSIVAKGPGLEAHVTFYPSLDLTGEGGGGLRFRADVTGDQPWCGLKVAHVYTGGEAREALRWMGLLRVAWDEKVYEQKLPLDGYFALGVCTLAPAVVERALTGRVTLWPLTHDPKYFQTDDPVDQLIAQLPSDTQGGRAPEEARLEGSIPFNTLHDVPLRKLREQLGKLHWLPQEQKR